MFRFLKIFFGFAALMVLLPSFASATKIKSYWKNPTATASSLQFKKILVIVPVKHEATRKVAEDNAVRIIDQGGMAEAVASYTVLGDTDLDNKELVKSKIEPMGFDGVIVVRHAGFEDTKKYEERDPKWDGYNYFWGKYYPGWGAVYNAISNNDFKIYVETMFFSLKDQKLIWAGITETKNPKNPAMVVEEIAEETTKYLEKQGFIAKRK